MTDDPKICILITLAVVTGGYFSASLIHVAGPLAMVVAGLYIGNQINTPTFDKTAEHFLEIFWEMLDDILNGVLFVLIGLVVFTLDYPPRFLAMSLVSIPIVLLARATSVGTSYPFDGFEN